DPAHQPARRDRARGLPRLPGDAARADGVIRRETPMSALRTPICDLFGIDTPIFGAGMGGVTLAPLAGAVSAAGGLGVMGLTFPTPAAVRAEIQAVRRITDKPFGVGLMIPTDIPGEVAERNVPPFPDFLADLLPRVAGLRGEPPPP